MEFGKRRGFLDDEPEDPTDDAIAEPVGAGAGEPT